MSHLLDASACIDHLRHGPASKVTTKMLAAQPGSIFLCSVVIGELLFGARRSKNVSAALSQVRAFGSSYQSLPFDDRAANEYSIVRTHLAGMGQLIGANDMLIAAIAVANGLTLVTHNTNEFSRVPHLLLEDWQ